MIVRLKHLKRCQIQITRVSPVRSHLNNKIWFHMNALSSLIHLRQEFDSRLQSSSLPLWESHRSSEYRPRSSRYNWSCNHLHLHLRFFGLLNVFVVVRPMTITFTLWILVHVTLLSSDLSKIFAVVPFNSSTLFTIFVNFTALCL